MPLTGQDGWVVLIPVKELGAAKTRLHVPHRDRVALAMSVDTVDAAASASTVRAVVVVTDDPRALAAMQAPKPARPPCAGVCVLPDAPRAGLNAALRHAAAVAAARHPDAGLAALAGDLPALRPAELDRALAAAAAAGGRSFVADAAGGGTVLLCAAAGVELRPAFGAASRSEHVASGARDLTSLLGSEVAGLRRDVDTVGDLFAAAALGLGPATRQAAPDAGRAEAWQDLNHDTGAGVPGPNPGRSPAQAAQRAPGTT